MKTREEPFLRLDPREAPQQPLLRARSRHRGSTSGRDRSFRQPYCGGFERKRRRNRPLQGETPSAFRLFLSLRTSSVPVRTRPLQGASGPLQDPLVRLAAERGFASLQDVRAAEEGTRGVTGTGGARGGACTSAGSFSLPGRLRRPPVADRSSGPRVPPRRPRHAERSTRLLARAARGRRGPWTGRRRA